MNRQYLEIFGNIPEVKGFFATKNGACDGSPYQHKALFRQLQLDKMCLVWPQQVHGDHIAVITEKRITPLQLPDTDGLITALPGVLLTTVHADCLALYFYDSKNRGIGLIHAGWRGTALGIAAKTVRMFSDIFGSCAEELKVYIGPGIGPCCFEVGKEVYDTFKSKWPFVDAYTKNAGMKYYMDLKNINRRQLLQEGLSEKNIEISPHCTCCEPDLFCSYRREGGTYKRMGAGLCLL